MIPTPGVPDGGPESSRTSPPRSDRRSLAVVAGVVVVNLLASAFGNPWFGLLAVVLLPLGLPRVSGDVLEEPTPFISVLVVMLLPALAPLGGYTGDADYLSVARAVTLGLPIIILAVRLLVPERLRAAVAIGAVILATVPLLATLPPSLDVWALHVEASDALREGENPYGPSVAVRNGSPLAEPGEQIVGYPYPPATLLPFALAGLVGDPRLASAVAWLVVLLAARSFGGRSQWFLALAATSAWPLILWSGWTEPVTLAYLAVAVALWARAPRSSGALLGLAVASKQYLVPLVPLVLLAPVTRGSGRRLSLVLGAGVPLLVAFAASPGDFLDAAIFFHLNEPPRPDSSNLVGILAGFGPVGGYPGILGLVISTILGFVLARRATDPRSFLTMATIVLAVTFFTGSQAFPNYWFLVLGSSLFVLTLGAERAADVRT